MRKSSLQLKQMDKPQEEVPELIEELYEELEEIDEKKEARESSGCDEEDELFAENLYEEKPPQELLSLYLKEMDVRSLFTPEQEVLKAQEVQKLKEKVWKIVKNLPFISSEKKQEYSESTVKEAIHSLEHYTKLLRTKSYSKARVKKESGLSPKKLKDFYHQLVHFQKELEQKRNEFVEANLRLVVKIANRYRNYSVSVADLIQEGNLGLIRAVEKFDWTKGFKFSSYATWWIHQAIIRALAEKSKLIKVPVYLTERIRRLDRATRTLAQELEKEPNMDELAKKLDMKPEDVWALIRLSKDPISLEAQVRDMEEVAMSDIIEDTKAPRGDEITDQIDLIERLEEALKLLTPKEEMVLRLRYGLDGNEALTLEEIGGMFGVSRERVRQIEQKGIRKLRHPSRSKILKSYIKN